MDNNELRQLVDLYFEGETSDVQEDMLRRMFRSGDVPVDLEKYRALFGFIEEERSKCASEESLQVVQHNTQTPAACFGRPFRFTRKFRRIMAVAASAAAVLAIAFIFAAKYIPYGNKGFRLTVGGQVVKNEVLAMMIVDRELRQLQDMQDVLDMSIMALQESAEMRDSTLDAIGDRITLEIKLQ